MHSDRQDVTLDTSRYNLVRNEAAVDYGLADLDEAESFRIGIYDSCGAGTGRGETSFGQSSHMVPDSCIPRRRFVVDCENFWKSQFTIQVERSS